MNTLKKLLEWWRSYRAGVGGAEIECPYCSTIISLPSLIGVEASDYGAGRINVVAPGSIIPCPKCGRNLSEFIRTRGR